MNHEVTKNIKILYVEDDDIARENGVEYLENFFEHIEEASNAIDALKLYETMKPDIIITDIQMPKLNGLEFISRIRKEDAKTQVIVISAFSDTSYLLRAIELQLVKYLIKPVQEKDFEEALSLCVDAIANCESNIVHLNATTLYDTFNQTLWIENNLVNLRTKELMLLHLLITNKKRYVTYSEIENYIWHDDAMSKDALKTVVKNLKGKLQDRSLIVNLSGTGYKINV